MLASRRTVRQSPVEEEFEVVEANPNEIGGFGVGSNYGVGIEMVGRRKQHPEKTGEAVRIFNEAARELLTLIKTVSRATV